MTAPADHGRRSPVYRELEGRAATFAEIGGGAVAMTAGAEADTEIATARRLGFADLTLIARSGYKGAGALAWVGEQDHSIPETNHTALVWSDGIVIARLADTEVLLLGGLDGGEISQRKLSAAWSEARPQSCFPVPRADSNAEFLISGVHAPTLLAKLCAVDLRPGAFPNLAIAQTVLARINAIILRADLGATLAYRTVFDIASARYLWRCIGDAAAEFNGSPVGLSAARHLTAESEG